jgi:hypothetical protein
VIVLSAAMVNAPALCRTKTGNCENGSIKRMMEEHEDSSMHAEMASSLVSASWLMTSPELRSGCAARTKQLLIGGGLGGLRGGGGGNGGGCGLGGCLGPSTTRGPQSAQSEPSLQ